MQPLTTTAARDLVPLVTVDDVAPPETRALTVTSKPRDAFGTRLAYERIAEAYTAVKNELASLGTVAGPRAQGNQLALWVKEKEIGDWVSGPSTLGTFVGGFATVFTGLLGGGSLITAGLGALTAGALATVIYAKNSASIVQKTSAKARDRRLSTPEAKPLIKILRNLDPAIRAALREPILDMLGDKYRCVLNVEAQSDIYNLFNATSVPADPVEARAAAFVHHLDGKNSLDGIKAIIDGASDDEIKVMRVFLKDAGYEAGRDLTETLTAMRDGATS